MQLNSSFLPPSSSVNHTQHLPPGSAFRPHGCHLLLRSVMEPETTKGKHDKPATATSFFWALWFVSRTVLAPALSLAFLLYARSSLPKLLSCALEHTSKAGMFFFCNGILLFLIRPLCGVPANGERREFAARSRESGHATGGPPQAAPVGTVPVGEFAESVCRRVKVEVEVQQGQQAEGAALKEVEAGDVIVEDMSGEEEYVQLEEDVEEEDNCSLSNEELKKKADEFIENFKRQRSFEAMQLVAA